VQGTKSVTEEKKIPVNSILIVKISCLEDLRTGLVKKAQASLPTWLSWSKQSLTRSQAAFTVLAEKQVLSW